MPTTIRLVARDGALYFPLGGYDDDFKPAADAPSLLMKRYAAGDVDTLPWPLVSPYRTEQELRQNLASALYDERECNECFPVDASIELPDGTPFDMDAVTAEVA